MQLFKERGMTGKDLKTVTGLEETNSLALASAITFSSSPMQFELLNNPPIISLSPIYSRSASHGRVGMGRRNRQQTATERRGSLLGKVTSKTPLTRFTLGIYASGRLPSTDGAIDLGCNWGHASEPGPPCISRLAF
ncbi:hypothetical protein ACLOJK_032553 [Asimina triloba]